MRVPFLAAALILGLTTPSLAAVLRVPRDFPTIQDAIVASTHGDIIELTDGVFTGPGNRDVRFVGRAVTVAGTRPIR